MPKSGPRLRRKPMKPNVPSGIEAEIPQDQPDSPSSPEGEVSIVQKSIGTVLMVEVVNIVIIAKPGVTIMIKP